MSATTSPLADAPEPLVAAELLYESTPFFSRMFGWYWPTSEKIAYEAEGHLLSSVRAPLTRQLVRAGDHNINTVTVRSTRTDAAAPERTVVMCHGYGAGAGMWFKNLDAVAAVPNTTVHAIDWLGMGRSSRPAFNFKGDDEASSLQVLLFVDFVGFCGGSFDILLHL